MKKSMIRAIFNSERGNYQLMKLTEEKSHRSGVVSDAYDELVNLEVNRYGKQGLKTNWHTAY